MSNQEKKLTLIFVNLYQDEKKSGKSKANKPIYCYIKRPVVIYEVKKKLINFFAAKIKKEITDFRLVDKEQKTIENNYFESKYNDQEAYGLLEEAQKFYQKTYDTDSIYFLTVKSKISTTIIYSEIQKIDIPLAFETSYDQWKCNVQEGLKEKIDLSEHPFHVFQNTDKLDEVSEDVDMKQYQKMGLRVYLFPVQVQFKFKSVSKTMLLKFDWPLTKYLKEINQKLGTEFNKKDFLFQIQKDDETNDIIDLQANIHDILKKQDKEPVVIRVLDKPQKKTQISISLPKNDFTFSYRYNHEIKIGELIDELKKYFNISNYTIKLSKDDGNKAQSNDYVKNFTFLTLHCDSQDPLTMTRTFIIKDKEEPKEILPNAKVSSILKEIAYEHNSVKSLIELKLDETVLKGKECFGSYFIPPEKKICAEIKEFPYKINLAFKRIEKEKEIIQEIKTGFTQDMKLKSLRESKIFASPDLKNQDIFFFFDNKKLDENKSFKKLGIKSDSTIDVYVSKYYLYKFNNKLYPFPSDTKLIDVKSKIINDKAKLIDANEKPTKTIELESYFIDIDGKPDNSFKNGISNSFENGKILEIKKVIKMNFKIDQKYDISIQSTKQVKDIIAQLSKMNGVPSDKIQLYNDVNKELRSLSYLYSSFNEQKEGYTYSIISRRARGYTFLTAAGKFINESFLPTTKIAVALEELRKSKVSNGKSPIGEKSIITYQGRVIDQNSTFSSIINDSKEDDEENPLNIEDEQPPMIKIKLTFQFGKDNDEKIADCELDDFIKPTTAYDIRYWASQLSKKNIETDDISLISNGEMLNDDEEINEDAEVTVVLNHVKSEHAKLETTIALTKNVTKQENDIFQTQRIDQKKFKKAVESSDESELEDYDEEEEVDILKKSNGTYEPSPNGPEDEYIFKFKIINGDELPIQLPSDATVMDAKEKIAEIQETDIENITIFLGNQRLADFNKFTNLKIPKEVKAFSIKIINLQDTLVCTRVKLKKT